MKPRTLAYCSIFGAAGILLPFLFHLLHLGSVFMPMYLPLVALGYFTSPSAAALTAFVVPLVSGLFTGMPPYYPPIAPIMSIELACMAGLASWLHSRHNTPVELSLALVLLLGRFLSTGLFYASAHLMDLPPGFIAGITLLSGFPGIILMMAVIPQLVRVLERAGIPRKVS